MCLIKLKNKLPKAGDFLTADSFFPDDLRFCNKNEYQHVLEHRGNNYIFNL